MESQSTRVNVNERMSPLTSNIDVEDPDNVVLGLI